MKSAFSSRRNKIPHNNEGKENKETPFFSKESKKPFFNITNGAVQTKLTVGQPGDKYEKEADSMADAVVNNASKPNIQSKEISSIQRESLATPQEDEKLGTAEQRMEEDKLVQEKPEIQKMGGEQEEELQTKPEIQKMGGEQEEELQTKPELQKMGGEQEEELQTKPELQRMGGEEEEELQTKPELQRMGGEEEEELQTKRISNVNHQTANTGLSNKIKNKSGNGRRMSKGTKAEMESSFGVDFGNVNIHTDQDAVKMNKELGAQAFTHGKDVYFNSGKYNPDSREGKHLLAHELTHVVQQGGKELKKKEQTSSKSSAIDVTLGFNAFIPNSLNAPFYKGNKAWKKEPNPFSSKLFASDNRNYNENGSSRIWQKGIAKFDGINLVSRSNQRDVGESHQADPVYNTQNEEKIIGIKNVVTKKAPDKGEIDIKDKGDFKGFNFRGEASYPFSSVAPDIDFDVNAFVKIAMKNNNYYAFVIFSGSRNDFPAYEAFAKINGSTHYLYTYRVGKNDGPGLINLNSSTDLVASTMVKI